MKRIISAIFAIGLLAASCNGHEASSSDQSGSDNGCDMTGHNHGVSDDGLRFYATASLGSGCDIGQVKFTVQYEDSNGVVQTSPVYSDLTPYPGTFPTFVYVDVPVAAFPAGAQVNESVVLFGSPTSPVHTPGCEYHNPDNTPQPCTSFDENGDPR